MKKYIGLLPVLVLSNSAFAIDTDKITESLERVCLTPSQQGKYWTVTTKGSVEANSVIRWIVAGIDGEATFTKGEWDGVQQVLKSAQAGDNDSFRKCVRDLAPLFFKRFEATDANTNKSQTKYSPKKNQAITTSSKSAQSIENDQKSEITQNFGPMNSKSITVYGTVNGDIHNNGSDN